MLEGFKKANGQKISPQEIIEVIESFILEKPQYNYKLFIGTDSEIRENITEFISVIVVHRVGYGARYFWKKTLAKKNLDLYSRLWQEALLSLELSQKLLYFLTNKKLKFDFEVHLDLGTNGKSKSVVKELINLIRSYGFEVKIKPQSYAASKIADHLL
ncbi:MAG: hypothetical protein KatS3mg095_0032 [Candidatus Parcubacteria bacterium]|nr:MAG: hypothetical protein KatS3mg095_0032 [Candidatus Parcubacteria bacterium]